MEETYNIGTGFNVCSEECKYAWLAINGANQEECPIARSHHSQSRRPTYWADPRNGISGSERLSVSALHSPGDQKPDPRCREAPRLLAASFIAYIAGEFLNSFVMARLKLATRGRWLWSRTISSTLVGQGLDSAIFITGAFAGVLPGQRLLSTILAQWAVKTAYEVLATPLTYAVVTYLKRREGMDAYDLGTNFNPFRLAG